MTTRAEKQALFEAIALMGKAFASPRRLEMLDLLAQAPRTVDELARASEQSTANTSQHLQALHSAGLVTRTREGRLAELPADREIVAYCRGPICAYAHDAVRRLRAKGHRAQRLEDGWPEWRLAEETTESTTAGGRARRGSKTGFPRCCPSPARLGGGAKGH